MANRRALTASYAKYLKERALLLLMMFGANSKQSKASSASTPRLLIDYGSIRTAGLIDQKGTRLGKRGGDKILYELTLRGKAALKLDEKSVEEFLQTATEEQLQKFIDLFLIV